MRRPVELVWLLAVGAFSACSCDPDCRPNERLVDGICVLERPHALPLAPTTIAVDCTAGERFCTNNSAALCNADGLSAETKACVGNNVCRDGACVPSCRPGAPLSCADATTRVFCEADGITRTSSACPASAPLCVGGVCTPPPPCTPGATTCVNDVLTTCQFDGMSVRTSSCPLGCDGSRCLATCVDVDDDQVGCDFVVVKLENYNNPVLPFAITLSNTTNHPAQVQLRRGNGNAISTHTVPAESLRRIDLATAITVDASSLSKDNIRVVSDTPITVHQFNPTNNVGSYSNDASLLLPTGVGGTEYYVVSWLGEGTLGSFGGPAAISYSTVIATQPGRTTVEITPARDTLPGVGVPQLRAGVTHPFSLSQGDVLSISADDTTGMHITSNQIVTAFVGNNCASIPNDNTFCDHLEEQLLPVRLWGRESIVPKFARRGREPDWVSVIAARDGTVLSTEPQVAGLDGVTLDAGAFVDVLVDDDFVLNATDDVLVTQFMVGSGFGCATECAIEQISCPNGPSGLGDPSQLQVISSDHFATEYLVLVPDDYSENHLSITAPLGAEVRVDRTRVTLTPIGSSGMGAARLDVSSGLRRVAANMPFGLYVYGYDCDVSYAYPGGLR